MNSKPAAYQNGCSESPGRCCQCCCPWSGRRRCPGLRRWFLFPTLSCAVCIRLSERRAIVGVGLHLTGFLSILISWKAKELSHIRSLPPLRK